MPLPHFYVIIKPIYASTKQGNCKKPQIRKLVFRLRFEPEVDKETDSQTHMAQPHDIGKELLDD
jgi:hypothetical protein